MFRSLVNFLFVLHISLLCAHSVSAEKNEDVDDIPCAFWCKNICNEEISYYCCSYDLSGNPKSFVYKTCEQKSEKLKSQCPKTKPAYERNCMKEMKEVKVCKNNEQCKEGQICCEDTCMLDDKKICKNPSVI